MAETLLLGLVGAMVIFVLVLLWQRVPPEQPRRRPRMASGWRTRANEICADGREVVDLTAMTQAGEPGSGLTLEQLRTIEGRSELLIGQLDEAELTAPSELAHRLVSVAALHARALHDLVATERRLRLTAISPDVRVLKDTAHQLAQERVALDQSLQEISTMSVDGL